MQIVKSLVLIACFYTPMLWAQCAPGIPSAGNPGCIPPNQQNSPYNQASPGQPIAKDTGKWADRWGAIALDDKSGRAGTITGQESKAKATSTALQLCKQHGGDSCEVLITFFNQCAAASQNKNGGVIFASSAATKEEAEPRALEKCGGDGVCQLVYSDCSYQERIQ